MDLTARDPVRMNETRFADFYIKVKRGTSCFIAYAKRAPFSGCDPILLEPGDLWFEFGDSEEEAVENLINADLKRLLQ